MTLPKGWAKLTIGEVVEPIETDDPTRRPDQFFRYVDIGSIDNSRFMIAGPKEIAGHDAPSRARRKIKAGDVLFSTVRPYLKNIAQVPEHLDDEFTSTGICVLRSTDAILPGYLFRRVISQDFIDEMTHASDGTMYPAIADRDVFGAAIALPPLSEQRRIVTKLDTLNAHLVRARAELDRVPVLAQKLRDEALSATFNEKSAQGVALSEVLEDIRYGTARKCDYAAGSTPVLRIPNVQGGRIDLTDLKSADFEAKEISKLALNLGDVLVIRSNGSLDLVGRSAVVDASAAGMLYAGYLIRLRPNGRRIRPLYLQHFLSAPQTRSVIERAARSSSGVNNVNAQQLQALWIPLPDITAQDAAIGRVNATFAHADRIEAEATRAGALLARLESSILAKAFRGELVPQDDSDEPASKLLDRIRTQRATAPKKTRSARRSRASG